MINLVRNLVLFVSFFGYSQLKAANVDTVETFSGSMGKIVKAVVITPEHYKKKDKFPVLYILHGYSRNYATWITYAPSLKQMSDQYGMIMVCPDGNFSSWYLDSPLLPQWKYETYISNELVKWIDDNYKTIKDKKSRAITGLSMGGHGALYLAIRHQDVYGAAGSMSGGVDFRPFPDKWDIAQRLGDYKTNRQNWDDHVVINMVSQIKPELKIMIDCGIDDFFYPVNEALHQVLLANKISHDYVSRPGKHDWDYWGNAIHYQVMFMDRFFNTKN